MDKIVVITGGTSGIGKALCKKFEDNGDIVITVSRRQCEGRHYVCDVSDRSQVDDVIEKIRAEYSRIDILVNNAGYGLSGISELIQIDEVKKIFDVNVIGVINMTQSALKIMSRGAKVINISSAMALFPVPYRAMYASSKSAVLTLSYAMYTELRSVGISVVAICPGDIRTEFTDNRVKDHTTNERYGDSMEYITMMLDHNQDKRMDVDVCAKKIYKIILKKKNKPMYIIGAKYKLLYLLSNITPKKWLLNITSDIMDGRKK